MCLMMRCMAVVQLMLLYTEATLIAQYIFQIPTRLHCHIFTAQEQVRCTLVPVLVINKAWSWSRGAG